MEKDQIMPNFDKTLRPQDDYFGFVNNKWIAKNPIPPTENRWGTFDVLRDKSANEINKIVKNILKQSDTGLTHNQKILKTYFTAALSYNKHRANHLKTLTTELQKINNIATKDQLAHYLGDAHRYNILSFWAEYDSVDDKNSTIQVLCFCQSGLSLPSRDYYLKNTSHMKNIRSKYQEYFQAVHQTIPEHSPSNWQAVWEIELELAKASWSDTKLRDVEKNYTRFTIDSLKIRFPKFNWLEYFKGLAWKNTSDNIVVNQPSFLDKSLEIINNRPLDEIKDYLSWRLTNSLINWVDEALAKLTFDFYENVISGKKEDNPIWKRAVLKANRLIIGEIIGQEYVARHFPESSKNEVLAIVEDIRAAYHKRIDKVTWMKPTTKKLAHKKLDNTKLLIGYPSKWQNFDKLSFKNYDQLANILITNKFSNDIDIATIGKKPDPEKWQQMDAHTVNAYYDPNKLVICFPAAILQPPFYDPTASYATNMGGIGSVIGHELTHGFDDQGSQFDEHGNVKKWQSNAEKNNFNKLTQSIIDQANNYETVPGTFLQGKLVIGEAIADVGGIELAIEALKAKTKTQNIKIKLRELFVNAATIESTSQRDEYSIRQALNDPHPPSKFRINCVVPHIDTFYSTYDVTAKDKLYLPPEKRSHIW